VLRFLAAELGRRPFQFSVLEHDLPRASAARVRRPLRHGRGTDPLRIHGRRFERLFLSRAAEALAGGGDVFLSFRPRSRQPGVALPDQRAIAEMGRSRSADSRAT
jgi:hypothetical protein